MKQHKSDARLRLQQAAVALFGEHGYDGTTAAEIAARAGVTERTFFRHFPDKREVLFDGQAVLVQALTASIAAAPATLGPLDMLFRSFRSVVRLLEDNRPFSKPRQAVISATPTLRERELAKLDALADALAQAMEVRGVQPLQAALAARAGLAAFAQATLAWLEDERPSLDERLAAAERSLRALVTSGPASANSDHRRDTSLPDGPGTSRRNAIGEPHP
jgi:AcrR family transcriptional regulator